MKRIVIQSKDSLGHILVTDDTQFFEEGNQEHENYVEPLMLGANEVTIKKPTYDKNEVYTQIEALVRDHQDGRTINMLLEVEPDYFVYCETNVENWESKNYYVNYSWDGFTVKADFTNKATRVITNSNPEDVEPLMMNQY